MPNRFPISAKRKIDAILVPDDFSSTPIENNSFECFSGPIQIDRFVDRAIFSDGIVKKSFMHFAELDTRVEQKNKKIEQFRPECRKALGNESGSISSIIYSLQGIVGHRDDKYFFTFGMKKGAKTEETKMEKSEKKRLWRQEDRHTRKKKQRKKNVENEIKPGMFLRVTFQPTRIVLVDAVRFFQ